MRTGTFPSSPDLTRRGSTGRYLLRVNITPTLVTSFMTPHADDFFPSAGKIRRLLMSGCRSDSLHLARSMTLVGFCGGLVGFY